MAVPSVLANATRRSITATTTLRFAPSRRTNVVSQRRLHSPIDSGRTHLVRHRSMSSIAATVSAGPKTREPGAHWRDATGTKFQNPWDSYFEPSQWQLLSFLGKMNAKMNADDKRDVPRADELIPRMKPTWGDDQPGNEGKIKVTWLGHAAALAEMPLDSAYTAGGVSGDAASTHTDTTKAGTVEKGQDGKQRGVTVLFDPVFSRRCSPTQMFGSIRYQPAPATVPELPEVDIIVISHNHYDHQDNITLAELYEHYYARPPLLFIPLNNTHNLPSSIPRDRIIEMDWWEERDVQVQGKGNIKITCTPAQHMTARGLFDRYKSLWASWAIKHVPSQPEEAASAPSLWFGGDTGYLKTTNESLAHDANPEGTVPHCPAFKEIGERVGPFSIALIPIGAYGPRWFLSNVHTSPAESVRIFKDVKAKQAIGIHWGTWHMAWEPVDEPPKILADVRGPMGVTEEQFGVMKIGETRAYARSSVSAPIGT